MPPCPAAAVLRDTYFVLLLSLILAEAVKVPTLKAADALLWEDSDGRADNMTSNSDLSSCFSATFASPNPNVTFHLYTRSTSDHELHIEDEAGLASAPFVPNQPVKILIHGYTGNKDFSPNTEIRPALLAAAEYNVISVDWGRLSASPCYLQATYNVAVAGLCTARLLEALLRARPSLSLEQVHVIGFSLGAQVAGQIARYLRAGTLTRITGLDPAMPLFATLRRATVLDESDAKFVDIIHTNAGNKGKLGPNGHADFYVNGGASQPGCSGSQIYDPASCAHARAPLVYAESISAPPEAQFEGRQCSSWMMYRVGLCRWDKKAIMGEHADPSVRGQFFLNTKADSPFALGQSGLPARR